MPINETRPAVIIQTTENVAMSYDVDWYGFDTFLYSNRRLGGEVGIKKPPSREIQTVGRNPATLDEVYVNRTHPPGA